MQKMDMDSAEMEAVTISDILELATWDRHRTSEELQRFINNHHDNLPTDIVVE